MERTGLGQYDVYMAAFALWASAIWKHEDLDMKPTRARAMIGLLRERTRKLIAQGRQGAA